VNLELTVRVININKGHNEYLAQRSETLNGYEVLVDKFREYGAVSDNEQAARQAISFCLENNFLKDFLETHKTEVFKMLLMEGTRPLTGRGALHNYNYRHGAFQPPAMRKLPFSSRMTIPTRLSEIQKK
jgi:hypothetical protein